jgi:hypothetical protein
MPPSPIASSAEIQRRIVEGNRRRLAEQRKQREYDQMEREEKEEMEQIYVKKDVSKYISNIIISLIFVSMPLTEPEVDWIQVLAYALVNVVWTVFFHRHDWYHYGIFIVINMLLVIWTPYIHSVPGLLASIPPSAYAIFLGSNSAAGAALYVKWIDKAPSRRVRDERLDYSLTGLILANVLGILVSGAVPLEVLENIAYRLMYGIVNFSR